ncbi:MAG TPA: hypothetical protein VFA26_25685 [Gemmataceae bacterium]|nr:hypothetical protein [Gemmataceae bacterium]
MRKFLGVALAAVLAATASARGDDAADARAVLDQAIKAMGGEANLTRYKAATWKGKGKINLMGNEIEFTGEWKIQMPGQYRAEVQGDFNGIKFKQVRAIDGDKGWQQRNDEAAEDLDKEAVAEEKKQLAGQALAALVPLKGKG